MNSAIQISEPALLIRISQCYKRGMSLDALYEVTRGVWVIGDRRHNAHIAFSIADGIVREIYSIKSWHPAGSTPYKTRTKDDVNYAGRWEFIGEAAPEEIRKKYLDKSVAHYFKRGAANPIMYVNI